MVFWTSHSRLYQKKRWATKNHRWKQKKTYQLIAQKRIILGWHHIIVSSNSSLLKKKKVSHRTTTTIFKVLLEAKAKKTLAWWFFRRVPKVAGSARARRPILVVDEEREHKNEKIPTKKHEKWMLARIPTLFGMGWASFSRKKTVYIDVTKSLELDMMMIIEMMIGNRLKDGNNNF